MKKWLAWLLFALYFAAAAVAWAEPNLPPAPTSSFYVQDYAGILSAETKNQINAVGSQLAAKTKAQVVVVTIKSLEGIPIDEYSLGILRKWGVGDRTLNNGVVILVAVNDRKSRIEVGYGLEGPLPDAKTGQIQDEYMIPYFSQGNFNQGIYNGYLAVISQVAKEYNVEIRAGGVQRVHTVKSYRDSWWDSAPWWLKLGLLGALGLMFVFDWIFLGGAITYMLLSLFRFRGGGGGGGFGGGGGYGGGSGGGGGSSRNW